MPITFLCVSACNFLSEPVFSCFQFLWVAGPILGESYHLTTFLWMYSLRLQALGVVLFQCKSFRSVTWKCCWLLLLFMRTRIQIPVFAWGLSLYEFYFCLLGVPICFWTFFLDPLTWHVWCHSHSNCKLVLTEVANFWRNQYAKTKDILLLYGKSAIDILLLLVSLKLSYDLLDIIQLLEESICIADFSFCSKYIRQFHDESDSSSTVYCYCFPFFVLRNGTIWSLWLKCCNLDLLRNMQFGDLFDRWDGFGMFEHWNFDHKAVWRLEGCEDIFGEVFISF